MSHRFRISAFPPQTDVGLQACLRERLCAGVWCSHDEATLGRRTNMTAVDRVGGQGDSAVTIQHRHVGWTEDVHLSILIAAYTLHVLQLYCFRTPLTSLG